MKIDVSRTACVGAGQCVLVAEELFDQDDEGLVILLDDSPAPAIQAVARKAAALCPARAIRVEG